MGSLNPVKRRAAEAGFHRAGWRGEVAGIEASSQVEAQPMEMAATRAGALNRASAAGAQAPSARFAVGIEGGCTQLGTTWLEMGWVVVLETSSGISSAATTTGFPLGERIVEHLLLRGANLNDAVEAETGIVEIGRAQGYTGYICATALTRQHAYEDALVAALARWRRPELW